MKEKKPIRPIGIVIVFFTNAMLTLISFFIPILFLNSRARLFFSRRKYDNARLAVIKQQREEKKHSVVFYCSSAGEYEQARPIAERLSRDGVYVHFLFFSDSGFDFASLRKETLPFSLAPLDTIKNWRRLLSVLDPRVVVVVRHELWPCFLYEASKRAKVFLVNASLKSKTPQSLFIKKVLLEFVDKILAVSEREAKIFCESFSLSQTKVQVTGDSKYDRVLERVERFRNGTHGFTQLSQTKKKLILGSAWHKDCEVVLAAFCLFRTKHPNDLQLVIAPHQPNEEFLNGLIQSSEKMHISYKLFSKAKEDLRDVDLVIVDSVGVLFDLYGDCDLAFVGGALHHEVHNVLEPAAFGLPLAFGPRFGNSHEASEIASKNLAVVVHNTEECLSWMESSLSKGKAHKDLLDFVKSKSGATDRTLNEITAYLA